MHVKVCLNLTMLIARGRKVTIRSTLHSVSIKYEKLPKVCFQCECVIHLSKQYSKADNLKGSNEQLDTWLSVPQADHHKVQYRTLNREFKEF